MFALTPSTAMELHRAIEPQSVYVHIPFCRHRCGYCNFTLVADRDDLIGRYLDALQIEMQSLVPQSVETIFIGGGTPTHLEEAELVRLFQLIQQKFSLVAGGEYSIEANPQDVTRSKTELIAGFGVNRISIGAQSFAAEKLKSLERVHTAAQVLQAVEYAAEYCSTHSLDLIFAAPNETLVTWQADLQQAITAGVPHLSTYGLTIEKGTQFWNRTAQGRLLETSDDLAAVMYETAIDRLVAAGYEHYEVSNFAMPGHRSRHNQVYWTGKPFYAFGAGAASLIEGVRRTNHRSTTTYIKRMHQGESAVAEWEQLTPEQSARERLVFGLRRLEGIVMGEFETETGHSVEALAGREIDQFVAAGLLTVDNQNLRLTRRGLLVSDSLWPDLL
jgi:oxygen-independent coproporphyrinogen-3 oxidase